MSGNHHGKSRFSPRVLGVTGGTLFAEIAKYLPSPKWQPIVVLLAPSIAIGLSALTTTVQEQWRDYMDTKLRKRIFDDAENVLNEIIDNPLTDPETKKAAIKDLNKVRNVKRTAALKPVFSMHEATLVRSANR